MRIQVGVGVLRQTDKAEMITRIAGGAGERGGSHTVSRRFNNLLMFARTDMQVVSGQCQWPDDVSQVGLGFPLLVKSGSLLLSSCFLLHQH